MFDHLNTIAVKKAELNDIYDVLVGAFYLLSRAST